ncbi:MAG: mechanosensitive ion channel domain-containing protein [Terrimesophilobacter sp.]
MFEWTDWWGTLVAVAIALIANVIVAVVAVVINATAGKRTPWVRALILQLRVRAQLLVLLIAIWTAFGLTAPAEYTWWPAVSHAFLIATVVVGAWFLDGLATFGFSRAISRYAIEDEPILEIRRMRTQLQVIRRLTHVLISVIAVGVVLFSFPEVSAVGTSVLASAGILSLVAGLAAQSTLSNLVAGIQLVFSDAIRVGDVVVLEDEWGTIGEITLSYVVMYIWDERRLILPCTYFTSKPFESWTRNNAQITGTVYLDVDWRVPIDDVRAKFMEIVEPSEFWDGRKAGVLVTDARGGFVSVRFAMSAENSDKIWNLRCSVREKMVTWLQQEHPDALPTTRVLLPAAGRSDDQ